jgi:hypothetical protein
MGTDTKPLPMEEKIASAAITASIGKSAHADMGLRGVAAIFY